jgi:hypothetical protein
MKSTAQTGVKKRFVKLLVEVVFRRQKFLEIGGLVKEVSLQQRVIVREPLALEYKEGKQRNKVEHVLEELCADDQRVDIS